MLVSELYYFFYSIKFKNIGWSFCLWWVFFIFIGFLVSLMFVEVDVKFYVGVILGVMGGVVVGLV